MKMGLMFHRVLPLLSFLLPAYADPGALWKIVHGACVVHVEAHQGPAPCAKVDLAQHYALMKDRQGVAQYLLIPTVRVSGIESPDLLARNAPNYWRLAWQGRRFAMSLAPRKLADGDMSLAINPPWGHTQDQLHIHIDCVAARVRDLLHGVKLGQDWRPVTLDGVAYQARNFDMRDNAFVLLAKLAASEHTTMADWSMASVGADVLLATRREPAEKLQDVKCGG